MRVSLAVVGLLIGVAVLGALPAAGQTTERVSVATGGGQGDLGSDDVAISDDGRYIAFESDATDLVASDTNGAVDIFVHDRDTGQTTRVSVATGGGQATGSSMAPCISADGRYVGFGSVATDLVVGDTNTTWDVFVHDRDTGQTTRVSVATGGGQATGSSIWPCISAGGRWVGFQSNATDLVTGDTNGKSDAFLHDRQTGSTTRVSVATGGGEANGNSYPTAITPDGRYVVFGSGATDLVVATTHSEGEVFIHDGATGETTRISIPIGGGGANGECHGGVISADGRYVAFYGMASDLVPSDTNGTWDVFVRDRTAGQTRLASKSSGGAQGNGGSSDPSISGDGRFVAFESSATNFAASDTNLDQDIFVHDRDTSQTTRVSLASNGAEANGGSGQCALSLDGQYVAFVSEASNLVTGDTNSELDVFVRGPLLLPDLIVQSLTVTPNPCTAGQSVDIDTTVLNQGAAAVGSSVLQVWRHRTTPPSVTSLGDYTRSVGALVPGATLSFNNSFTPTYVGSRTAWAYAEAGNSYAETSETNNRTSRAYTIDPTDADLTFQSFTVTPDPVSLGNQATINAMVVNQGTDPAGPCLVQLWRHREAQPVLGTTGDYTHPVGPLPPAATEPIGQPFTPHYQGGRTAWGVVDSLNIVAENDENNNKTSDSYTIQPGITPDLVASVTATPDPVVLGNVLTLTVGVENTGPAAAAAFDLAAWRHRTDPPIVGSPPDYTWAIGGLASSGSTTRVTTFTPAYSGARTAWALADDDNAVVENDEVNNVASDAYDIVTGTEPDLVPSVTVTPDPLTLGDTATLTAGVQNLGSSAAGAFVLAAWYHRTEAPVVGSPPDASWSIAGLAAAGWTQRTSNFTPGYAGSRTAWAFADNAEAVLETNESNNIASGAYLIAETGGSGALAVTAASAEATRGGQVAISYSLSAAAEIEVRIRNVAGRVVARLSMGERDAGSHTETWNGLATSGARIPAGAYLCEIAARTEGGQSARAVTPVRLGR